MFSLAGVLQAEAGEPSVGNSLALNFLQRARGCIRWPIALLLMLLRVALKQLTIMKQKVTVWNGGGGAAAQRHN